MPNLTLLIVPPFAPLTMPSLGVHVLQASARDAGHKVSIDYANMRFANRIGITAYEAIANAPRHAMDGARVFAPFVFDDFAANSGNVEEGIVGASASTSSSKWMGWLQHEARDFCSKYADLVAGANVTVVGCTTTFDQTHAALALLRAIKRRVDSVVTILGGGNCEGPMAAAVAELAPFIDMVFSGESEQTFLTFLDGLPIGKLPGQRVVMGNPCLQLDSIPCPTFSEFFDQLQSELPQRRAVDCWISYETSRGCWWGQRSQCTFCGLNGTQMGYRRKSVTKAISDLQKILTHAPTNQVCMTDNIMPHAYHNTLVPALVRSGLRARIFYEQKSRLSYKQLYALSLAGIDSIQVGIESLSTRLLSRMKKGSTATQNLATLRFARACGINVIWNYLFGVPDENEDDYRCVAEAVPLLTHLEPPTGLHPISIDRFSPYFEQPDAFGIRNLKPLSGYREVFPAKARIWDLAYHFEGEYRRLQLNDSPALQSLHTAITHWQEAWNKPDRLPPSLHVTQFLGRWVVIDSRNDGKERWHAVSFDQARVIVAGESAAGSTAIMNWAIDNGLVLRLENETIPLAVADEETFPLLLR